MDMNNVSTRSEKGRTISSIARCVHILLVIHNVTSLMLLASRFKHQEYRGDDVTTTESTSSALATLKKKNSNHNIVIADFDMPGMDIYEFVRKVQHQRINFPVILIAEDVTTELVREAFSKGVHYLFSKPPNDFDIINTWHHIFRVTGELPAAFNDGDDVNPNTNDGAPINRKPRNMKRKTINTNKENKTDEDDGHNLKMSCMTWTTSLQAKFLEAIKILGEQNAYPSLILNIMKEPRLTLSQVSSHLQLYRNCKRPDTNSLETASPILPDACPNTPLSIYKKGHSSYKANINFTTTHNVLQIPRSSFWLHSSNFVGYTIEHVKQKLDALNYFDSGGVLTGWAIDPKHMSNKSIFADIGEQSLLFPQNFANMSMEGGQEMAYAHVTNGFQVPNGELVDIQTPEGDGTKTTQNYTINEKANDKGKAPLVPQSFGHMMEENGHLTNGLQDLTKEQKGDLIEMGMFNFGNVGNLTNMIDEKFGEGTSGANQQFPEMFGNDSYKIIPELEASDVNLWKFLYEPK